MKLIMLMLSITAAKYPICVERDATYAMSVPHTAHVMYWPVCFCPGAFVVGAVTDRKPPGVLAGPPVDAPPGERNMRSNK